MPLLLLLASMHNKEYAPTPTLPWPPPPCFPSQLKTPILRDLPYTLRVKLVLDTHQELLHTLSFFEDLDVPVVTEIVYRLKPMQVKRKVRICLQKNFLGRRIAALLLSSSVPHITFSLLLQLPSYRSSDPGSPGAPPSPPLPPHRTKAYSRHLPVNCPLGSLVRLHVLCFTHQIDHIDHIYEINHLQIIPT